MKPKNNTGFNSKPVVLLQSAAWYFLGLWFTANVILLAIGHPLGTTLSFIGLLVVLTTIIGRIVIMAEQFRRAQLYRFSILCYLLLLILIITSIEKLLIR